MRERDDDRGAVALEYALLIGGIALAIAGGIVAFGTALFGWFTELAALLP